MLVPWRVIPVTIKQKLDPFPPHLIPFRRHEGQAPKFSESFDTFGEVISEDVGMIQFQKYMSQIGTSP